MNQPEPFALGIADFDDTPQPPIRPAAVVRDELLRKAELEAEMLAAPDDAALRTAYFELLGWLAGRHSGLLTACLPELRAPLWFRCGTPDITALAGVFREHKLAVEMRATPQRILVIGAYAGYEAVDLALRHPRALILAVEPLADNLRLLTLNTTAWRRIRVVPAALWHSPTRLAASGRFQADWAVRLTDEVLDADRVVPALGVADALARAGWSHADMVLCDAAGSEREVFSNPLAAWLRYVDVAMVRPYEQLGPGGLAVVGACFPEAEFSRRTVGLLEVFERRTPLTALPPAPPRLPLLRAEPGLAPFSARDVAQFGWAFFLFDGASCQLHPNPAGGPAACVVFPLTLAGQTRLVSGITHAGHAPSCPVTFRAVLRRPGEGVLAEGSATVAARGSDTLTVMLPEGLSGAAEVELQTTMAEGAAHNQMAWARWIEPRLE